MNKESFVKEHLEYILNNDDDIRKYFDQAKTPEEKSLLEKGLKHSLETSYEKYAEGYFKDRGFEGYITKMLRIGGTAADVVGTYMFWTAGGMGIKLIGAGSKTLADIVDYYHYKKYAQDEGVAETAKNDALIIGEGLLERFAAYCPYGVGEVMDFFRGTKKFDSKIIKQAVYHAKDDFIKQFGDYKAVEERKMIPLGYFDHPAYAGIDARL